ncbi:MAG: hypothetical protein KDB60_13320 [Propionibacteriaceae bacterium]|nr:hypothetical protein [Propionibacteriaceae bacterium]
MAPHAMAGAVIECEARTTRPGRLASGIVPPSRRLTVGRLRPHRRRVGRPA